MPIDYLNLKRQYSKMENKIKKEAKKLKKEMGIQHSKALDIVAQKYGYQNYRHFLNTTKGVNS